MDDEIAIEREATRFAIACGEEQNLSLVQLCFMACASWIVTSVKNEISSADLKVLCAKCGFAEVKE